MYLAQDIVNINPSGGFTNLNNVDFQTIITAAIYFVLMVTAIILFFILIGGGIAVILGGARGDQKATGRGQTAITSALIGLLIVFGAWAIMTLIGEFFGVDILRLNVP